MQARYCFAAIAVLLVALPVHAQERYDLQIARDVVTRINTYSNFTIFDDVSFSVDNGVVTLRGKVTMPYKRDDIGARVARIEGVREVDNRIEVLRVSTVDDRLRQRIARAIYGHPSFWTYAAMANPPIHIIVEGGRVTLTGVVNSNVERMLARSLATGWGELSVDNNLRTEQEIGSGSTLRGLSPLSAPSAR